MIGGYKVTALIFESRRTKIYRAVKGDCKYVLKTVTADSPSSVDLAGLRHEYSVLKDVNIDGVVKAIELVSFGNGLALVLEDCENSQSLRQVDVESNVTSMNCIFHAWLFILADHIESAY